MPELQQHNFHYDFFESGIICSAYTRLPSRFSNFRTSGSVSKVRKVWHIDYVPPYLSVKTSHLDSSLRYFKDRYRLGFAMDLREFDQAGTYLRQQLGKKVFKNLRQDRQRLERDQNLQYKTYFGSLDRAEYSRLMKRLKGYIHNRFDTRNTKHAALQRWEHYESTVYEMILARNASMMVFYSEKEPIAININYHYGKVLHAAIISFDSEFQSYSPGRIMFYYQLEWCFLNNYNVLDLCWGQFPYKVKFCNAVFEYETHIAYSKNSFTSWLLAHYTHLKHKLIYYLVMLRDRRFKDPKIVYEGRWMDIEGLQETI